MSNDDLKVLRLSLVLVWLATAVVSLVEINGQSMELLINAGIDEGPLAKVVITSGACVDLLIGLVLAFWPSRRVYQLALLMMLTMTGVATLLEPSLWLHPLGPLLKNVPIAAVLWILIKAGK